MDIGKATLTQTHLITKNGKWANEISTFEVRVMVVAEGYAMVRRKGAMPFVCNVKNLSPSGGEE